MCILIQFNREFLCGDPKIWHQIRGTQMIATMKVISLAFDASITTTTTTTKQTTQNKYQQTNQIERIPNILEYFGYIVCPANCILGPWITYKEYLMNFKCIGKWQPKWFIWILINVCCAIFFLIMSNCVISWFFNDNSWKWLLAYRNAMAFRFSHYFVSFLSQSMMLTAGFTEQQSSTTDDAIIDRTSLKLLGYRITKPWLIEVPRSIVQVVVVWNVSMHIWLKQCKNYIIFNFFFFLLYSITF